MKKTLPFNIPFAPFSGTTFINCFASMYMFLENVVGEDNYECKQQKGQPCDSCGNCHNKTSAYQERLFFLFDTICGHSSLRCRFNGEPTMMQTMISDDSDYETDIINFLFDFTAYEYQKLTEPNEFKSAIIESVNSGKPVLAKVNEKNNSFRIITGYDGDMLISPEYAGAQNNPKAPMYDEIVTLYIIGNKGKLVFTPLTSPLEKGLKRIKKVIEYNLQENLWDEYIEKFKYWGNLSEQTTEEIRHCFRRAVDTMWYTFNCHNFGETFRHCVYEEMRGAELMDSWSRISAACDDLHTRAWSVIHLEASIDWKKCPEWGVCEIMPLLLEKMKQDDIEILNAVKHALDILHEKRELKSILINI